MLSFFERLKLNIEANPDKVVLRSEHYEGGITYKQLDEMSGKVCRYLKERNIGREDFVMVLMPREVTAYIAVIGVWKSGAAMTLLEDDYLPKRVDLIKEDLNCKLVITKEIFEKMMKCETCTDCEIPKEHDACYAAYTSGSTGKPKGILHEFGKLDMFDYDYENKLAPVEDGGRFAIITPLNFGPSIRNAVTSLMYGKCLYVVPQNAVKNKDLLRQYFVVNKINETSVTSSFAVEESFSTEYMKNIFVHSEPSNCVYFDGPNIINLYTLSEVVFPIFTFRIYKNHRKIPIGFANKNVRIKILGENGEEKDANEIGEITVEDPFTRGYINLPQKTAEVFCDGYFHTGDLGYFNEDGMFYLCGRRDDMIKINGNRIEPAEIEYNIKRILGVDNVISKGFSDNEHSFVAAYFLKNELEEKNLIDENGQAVFTSQNINTILENILPQYMIPSYYLVLQDFPKNANGKISRADFSKPNPQDYITENDEPADEKEAYFCRVFEKVLKLETVGANDDFFALGGDSVSAILAASESEKYLISAENIYTARTARNLAKINNRKYSTENLNNQNLIALAKPQPLLIDQKVTFDVQMGYPDFVINNLKRLFRINGNIDARRLSASVDKVLKEHPAFSTILKKDEGIIKMHYCPELFEKTEIEVIGKDELHRLETEQGKPFNMENSLLYRHRIYQCEDKFYLFLEIHHIISDGISLKNLFEEINNAYYDESFVIPTDYFYLLAQKSFENYRQNNLSKSEIIEMYNMTDYLSADDNAVGMDGQLDNFITGKYEKNLSIDKTRVTNNELYKKYGGNIFFLTCFLKTIAEYNNTDKACTFWIYNGRDNVMKKNIHGMLIKTLTMECSFADNDKTKWLEYVKNSALRNLSESNVSFVEVSGDGEFDFCPNYIYQKNILHINNKNIFEGELDLKSGGAVFEFHLIDNSDENFFKCLIKYVKDCYKAESIERFCALFEKNANDFIS